MKAYEGLIDKETFPAYVFFTLLPNKLDVNVHQQNRIKFQDEHLIAATLNSLTKSSGISGLMQTSMMLFLLTFFNSSKSNFNFLNIL